ncbi:MAG: ABC transporter permease, partial [Bacteroidota bacterium]
MIRFLFKGILRDSQRSRLPILIISIGVFLTVVLSSWISGVLGDMVDLSAKFTTGHVKIMTQAYAENEAQIPNDLALLDVADLTNELEQAYPDMQWVERIRFGGLMDLPDSEGETQAQGPVSAQGIALLDRSKGEIERLSIEKSMVRGRLPEQPGEILISDDFAQKINLQLEDTLTFFGSTMHGSMTFQNFKAVGTVRFGSVALDRGSILVDLSDARQVLDMNDAAGEILGYFASNKYEAETATEVKESFNSTYQDAEDEFSPTMLRLQDQNGLDQMLAYMDVISGVFVFLFVFAMSIVLWNTGLLGGLRRYKEFGIRLAMGEEKSHIYRTLLYEAVL